MIKTILAGLVAGILAFGLTNLSYPWFEPPEPPSGNSPPPKPKHSLDAPQAALASAAVAYCGIGLVFGAAFGFASAGRQRLVRAVGLGVIVGGVLAGAFGLGAGWLGQYTFSRFPISPNTVVQAAMLAQAAAWLIVGVGVGLVCNISGTQAGVLRHNVARGATAGVVAGALFCPLAGAAGALVPLAGADLVVPYGWQTQLLWLITAGVCFGVIFGGLRPRAAAGLPEQP